MRERGLGGGEFCRGHLPHHPVKIIAPFAAGGPSDITARILADKLSASLKQQFYVEDHAGAGGNIGMTQVARSAPDGYTILVASSSFIVNPSFYAHNPYDPYKDFVPVTLAVDSPNALFVHPSVPAKTVKELIALMKADPGKYPIANSGLGTTPMLASELFKLTFKLDVTTVPYNGGAPVIQAVVGNQTPTGFATLPPAYPQLVAGTLRALAVTSAKARGVSAGRADHGGGRCRGPGIRHDAGRLCSRRDAAGYRRASEPGNRRRAEASGRAGQMQADRV